MSEADGVRECERLLPIVAICALALLISPVRLHAEPPGAIASALGALASTDVTEQKAAVAALVTSGDRKVIPLLDALREGSLYTWMGPNGAAQIVIAHQKVTVGEDEFFPLESAYPNEPLLGADDKPVLVRPDELKAIETSRPLRIAIQSALERLKLLDPDARVRRSAAKTLADKQDLSALPNIESALVAESDPATRDGLAVAREILRLGSSAEGDRLAAVARLGEYADPDAAPRLEELRKGASPKLAAAIDRTLSKIRAWGTTTRLVYAAFSGFSLGSILILMSLGLAITFGVMGVINMAHGELMMIGAYTAFITQNWFQVHLPERVFGAYFVAALPLSFVVAAAAGWVLERSVIRFLYGRPLETLLATWGVSLILIQAARTWFGDLTAVVAPDWLAGGLRIVSGVQLPYNRVFIIALTAVCVAGVYLLLLRSSAGLRIRAVTQNRAMAAAIGIPTERVDAATFAIGSGLAGIAGCALTLVGNVDPGLGQNYIVDAFIVVVTGGVGKLSGTIIAALAIGWMSTLLEMVTDSAVMGKVLILVLVILLLQRRPSGLFPPRGRSVEH